MGMVINKGILLFLIAGVPLISPAQEPGQTIKKTRKGEIFLDISGGYSMPFGKYSDTDTTNKYSGYATGGFYGQFSATWIGKRHFGLSAAYCYQRNTLSPEAEHVTPDGQDQELGKNPWSNHYLLAGPAFIRHFGKVFVEAQLQVGIVLAFSSNFYITLPEVSDTGNNTTNLSQGNGFGVSMQALAGVGYRLSDRVSLNLRISYLGANPVRTKDYYYYYYYVDEFGEEHYVYQGAEFEIRKKISTLNLGVGIAIKI
jgi:hypothetical protein